MKYFHVALRMPNFRKKDGGELEVFNVVIPAESEAHAKTQLLELMEFDVKKVG